MPVIHVRGGAVDRPRATETLTQLARAVAAAAPCDVDDVWCTFTGVDVQTIGVGVRDDDGRIVYVDLWIRPRGDADAPGRALEAACAAAAAGFAVPLDDVWGTVRLVEPSKVFAGGSLIGP